MNWKAGDRAILVNCIHPMNEGQECVITDGPWLDDDLQTRWEVCCATGKWDPRAYNLKPIPDEYDGNQASSWDECPWKPKELVMI